MEYKGKLYGKVGKSYFPLEATTEDFERLEKLVAELQKDRANKKYMFDCYDRKGKLSCKTVVAKNKEDAILLFRAKHPDLAFDPPYNL